MSPWSDTMFCQNFFTLWPCFYHDLVDIIEKTQNDRLRIVSKYSWTYCYCNRSKLLATWYLVPFTSEAHCTVKRSLIILSLSQGFTAQIGASGSFCPQHITLPIKAQFFRTSDDNAPSPYMVRIFYGWFLKFKSWYLELKN